jgi:quercetin dioxygenase-like cupin family protein
MAYLKTKPYALRCDEGERLQSLGAMISVKATSQQTSGAFNLFDISCPPGFATPLHIHYTEDVAVYVLAGKLAFFWGNEMKEAAAGSYFFQPRGTPHGFRVEGVSPAHFLYMTIPAGFDCFVFEQELLRPEPEPEMVAARYMIEVLGPLPG